MEQAKQGMTEKELLTDLLNEEKYLIKGYADSITKASDKVLRGLMIKNLDECADLQYNVFVQMEKREMCKMQNADSQTIRQTKQRIAQLKQEIWG